MNQEKEVRTKFTTLYIDPIVMKRIKYYTQAADGEVSGLGTIITDDKGRHVVNNVFLLEQESSGADTELRPEAISKLITDMINRKEDPSLIKFWWHSHATMGVFWSGTDDTCAETLSKEYAFSLVVNKSGELRCRLDLYTPFRITFDGVKVTEIIQEDSVLKEECEKEVKEKVKSPYDRWNRWEDREHEFDSYYGNYYGHRKPYKNLDYTTYNTDAKSRIRLSEVSVSDIERLIDEATRHDGGVFDMTTWTEYIRDTLKDIFEKRFEKKAECKNPGTFDKDSILCTRDCKIKKACAYWTKFFDETEEDASDKLDEYNKSDGKTSISLLEGD